MNNNDVSENWPHLTLDTYCVSMVEGVNGILTEVWPLHENTRLIAIHCSRNRESAVNIVRWRKSTVFTFYKFKIPVIYLLVEYSGDVGV